jgi:serine protease Do
MWNFRFDGKALALLALAALPLAAFQEPAPEPPQPPEAPFAPNVYAFHMASSGSQSFLGVGVAEISGNRARELKLREEYGVEITRVEDDSAAAKAGLKVGDVVLDYQGQRVEGMEQFIRLVRETPVGREVKLTISRNGSNQTVTVVMGSQRGPALLGRNGEWFDMPAMPVPPVPPDVPRLFTTWSSAMLGIEAEGLNEQLGEYFGVKEGVLVRSVASGSPAEKAGIKAGDVLVKVDQTKVASPAEVTSAVHAARPRKTFPVEIMRDRHPLTLNVTMEAASSAPNPWQRAAPTRTIKM